ncbi:translational GTPase TypA [bacterium]|nr:translational GTPase TypA [bacterium]
MDRHTSGQTQKSENKNIRNIAIIAHVDHGKTTLVDAMFKQSGLFREGVDVEDRLMDSMDLEKERGITIAAKNSSIMWDDVKINIIDTPGHADFGGEVERALSMADGAVLLVDASEGPLPQTRFVLSKALEAGLNMVVVINKIDRQDARVAEVLDEIYDLFIDLDADEEQLEFPLLYAIGRDGIAQYTLEEKGVSLKPLLDTLVEKVHGPFYNENTPFQLLVSDLSYSDYLGRIAIGKAISGTAKSNDKLICMQLGGNRPLRVSKLQSYSGLSVLPVEETAPGDIVLLAGIEDVEIGDTISTADGGVALKRITVDAPTVSMMFSINTSPLAGTEGKFVQSTKIKARLHKETLYNVSIKLLDGAESDSTIVQGRGEFQMAILIEQMRREGFELCVGRPEVIFKKVDGKTLEPIEHVYIDCEDSFMGVVTEKLSMRKGRMLNMKNSGSGRVRIEFSIPSRGLIGYRDEFLTDTKGTGIMNAIFDGYEEHRGEFAVRHTGSIVGDRTGVSVPYALFNLEPRGEMFITSGVKVYEGMIVGEHAKDRDINVNPCKVKKLSNIRTSSKDEAVTLRPIKSMSLERAIHFIGDDELVEITPLSIRLRKRVLSAQKRHISSGKAKKASEARG